MITDEIINLFFHFPLLLLESLPDVNISIPGEVTNIINGTQTFLFNVSYILPLDKLMPILFISFSIKLIQILWALIIRIKSFIPTMGA